MTSPVPPEMRVYNLASDMLQAVEAAALALSITLPKDRYLTSGSAVHDCPQVAITCGSLRTGVPGSGLTMTSSSGFCAPAWSLVMTAEIVRSCAPVAGSSGVTNKRAVTDALKSTSGDAAVLMEAVNALSVTSFATIDTTIALKPAQGSFIAVVANMVVAMP